MTTPITDELASYGILEPELLESIRIQENAGTLSVESVEPILQECRRLMLENKELESENLDHISEVIKILKHGMEEEKHDLYKKVEANEEEAALTESKELLRTL